MAFIKRGEGTIVAVIETEELTDEQKKSAAIISVNKKNSKKLDETNSQDTGRN